MLVFGVCGPRCKRKSAAALLTAASGLFVNVRVCVCLCLFVSLYRSDRWHPVCALVSVPLSAGVHTYPRTSLCVCHRLCVAWVGDGPELGILLRHVTCFA